MPDNAAEQHLDWVRSLSGTTPTLGGGDAPAGSAPSAPKADNATSTSTPVQGAQGSAEIAAALEEGLARGDRR
jgi:hypothetical protein